MPVAEMSRRQCIDSRVSEEIRRPAVPSRAKSSIENSMLGPWLQQIDALWFVHRMVLRDVQLNLKLLKGVFCKTDNYAERCFCLFVCLFVF